MKGLNKKEEDFILEEAREKNYEDKEAEKEIEEFEKLVECDCCKERFEEEELDLVEGCWFCSDCEEHMREDY